mgnify:CR=1 FL=1
MPHAMEICSRRKPTVTGYTGTSIVIDPVNDVSIILLANAVHPVDGKSRMVRLRALISNIVASALLDKAE